MGKRRETVANSPRDSSGLSPVELMRIITLDEAAKLVGLSRRTLRDFHADKIVHISKRRVGMRMRDVLAIGEQKSA